MKIRLPDITSVYLCNGEDKVSYDFYGENTQNSDTCVRFSLKNDALSVYLSSKMGVRYVRLRWNNPSRRAVKVLGDAWERGYGDLEWRGVCPERCMPWYIAVSNGSDMNDDYSERLTECYGVGVQPSALCFWQYDNAGVTLWLDVRSGTYPTILNARELECATVYFKEYEKMSAFDALKEFCRVMSPNPYTTDHVVYGSNNWYYAYGKSSHEEIISDTKFVKRMTQGLANIPYMVIDDGWQPNSCDAPWDTGNERFPDMKALASEMKALGVRPGIWVRYLINGRDDEPRKVTSFPESWYLYPHDRVLDPSNPEVLNYVKETTERLVGWGYELIKHDFSTFDIFGKWGFELKDDLCTVERKFYDNTKTSAEIVKNFYKTIKDASSGAVIIGCNAIGHLCAGLHQLNRTGDDTSGFEWSRTQKMGVNTLAFRLCQNNSFFGADADCVGIMGIIPWELNSKWLYLLSRSSSSLFVSCKPNILSEEQENELKESFKVASVQKDEFIPLDWMETTCPQVYKINGEVVELDLYPKKGNESVSR